MIERDISVAVEPLAIVDHELASDIAILVTRQRRDLLIALAEAEGRNLLSAGKFDRDQPGDYL